LIAAGGSPRVERELIVTGGKEFLAAFNAVLNGSSAILLVAAYIAILGRHIRTHATLMITALSTSAIFLGTYIYEHARYGERTSGLQPSPLRTFYLILLLSHVLLAIGMLPPIVMTVWRAYKRQWVSHVRIARPTLYVWFYVSATGVVVYWMLYHLFPTMQVR
jgi:putative membrane protein